MNYNVNKQRETKKKKNQKIYKIISGVAVILVQSLSYHATCMATVDDGDLLGRYMCVMVQLP